MPEAFSLRPAHDYVVRLQVGEHDRFEGPLDLLLHLIEREELPITSVSLTQVTSQYLQYLSALEELRPEGIAEFLVMATRLLYIKSQALLPTPQAEDEEEEEDPGEALARQLREYKRFKEKAALFTQLEADGRRSFVRVAPPPQIDKRLEPGMFDLTTLVQAVYDALQEVDAPPTPEGVVEPHKVTIADKIQELRELLDLGQSVRFRQLLGHRYSRVDVVVSFLAVLELIKQRQVQVEQSAPFGDIVIAAALEDREGERVRG